jgi:uncharacterized protein with PIN domain
MSKTFTCRELGGICDEKFTGEIFDEIVQKAMPHMMSSDTHKEHIMTIEKRTGENKEQWFKRMQAEFDAKPENLI